FDHCFFPKHIIDHFISLSLTDFVCFGIGGGKACVHGDERHIGCREQEETSRARIRLDPSSPVSSLPTSPSVSSWPLSPPVSNSSRRHRYLVLGMETEQR
ncbi:unnamed protein product, partial [Brassica rapa subsp. trilocularis]